MVKIVALASAALLVAAAPATAATIVTLYSTGVDATGATLIGHNADSHWMLDGGAAYTGVTNGQFPSPPWVADTATSRWITPTPDAGNYNLDHANDGLYTYTETFSLAGYKTSTASVSGQFASDNTVDKILLNGKTLAASGGSFTAYLPFDSTGATFNAGVNTLTFIVRNFANGSGANPTGLRVELSGTADVVGGVPEPTTWVMLVAGFGLVGITARRRLRSVAA